MSPNSNTCKLSIDYDETISEQVCSNCKHFKESWSYCNRSEVPRMVPMPEIDYCADFESKKEE